jgi:hydrogenase nickel incorporation protein HypA/HybF
MHELSISMCILDVVEEEAARQGDARVSAVHLKLGPLSGVVKEALLASFDMARRGTSLEGCELIIEEMPIIIDCATCGAQQRAVSIQHLCCATCGTPAEKITGGRELEVCALELSS